MNKTPSGYILAKNETSFQQQKVINNNIKKKIKINKS